MRAKLVLATALRRWPPLFRFASRLFHQLHGSFRPLSPGGPDTVRRALEIARDERGEDAGDYYEFGLFRGYTFLCAGRAAEELGLERMQFHGFDSFQGLPTLEERDEGEGEFFEGQFSCSKKEVEVNLAKHGMDMSRMNLVEGFYTDSLTEDFRDRHAFRRAAAVLLDCDLYSSTRDALHWVAPYIGDGTILVFDDWKSYGERPDEGQPRAFRAFLDENSGYRSEVLWDFPHNGRAFVLRTVQAPSPATRTGQV